ncbi:MAG: hypothetical protein KatS3mg076_1096 [Candidatus Binatia bacterium]|nr:MAG: hypothetical protein KatS3mg076_1096 [Candidatus Binatia bacterium]
MARPQPIRVRPGPQSGDWVVSFPPGWELRLRRVLTQIAGAELPDPREKGLTPAQREARRKARRVAMQRTIAQFLADLITADIVGKEVALSTRNRYGVRKGSLREHVAAILREVSGSK